MNVGLPTAFDTPIFDGLVVLDLSQVFAGPLAARLLAEYGATVIKVERPPGGDISRQRMVRKGGVSGYFAQQNMGKQGLCVDLRTEHGKALLWRLIEKSDILIDGFRPGALAALGFTFTSMSERNQSLIVCELSALGRSGQLGSQKGYDPIGACYSGVAYCATDESDVVRLPSVATGDAMMAMCAFAGITTALLHRERSGRGQRVEVSLVDSYIQAHSSGLEAHSLSDGAITSKPVGGQSASTSPSGSYKAADGRLLFLIAFSSEEWERLCQCMDSDLAEDPTLRTTEGRLARRDEIDRMVKDWVSRQPTREGALERLRASGVAAAPVLSIGEVIDLPHNRDRGAVRFVEQPGLGRFAVPGLPIRFSGFAPRHVSPAPVLGADNRDVCRWLGLSTEETSQLVDSGVLSGPPPGELSDTHQTRELAHDERLG